MKNYTPDTPLFSNEILLLETTDFGHPDTINSAPKQLLQNDLALALIFDEIYVNEGFEVVFENEDPTALTSLDIKMALATQWDGSSSEDETSLQREDIKTALATQWDGSSSEDETAIPADTIRNIVS